MAKAKEEKPIEAVKEPPFPRLIVAGSFREFCNFLRYHNISTMNHKYVSQAEQLHGISRGVGILLVGTHNEREDWPQINNMIKAKGLKVKKYGN